MIQLYKSIKNILYGIIFLFFGIVFMIIYFIFSSNSLLSLPAEIALIFGLGFIIAGLLFIMALKRLRK
jgi:drug/metabolite transporter (DMT)-like permease